MTDSKNNIRIGKIVLKNYKTYKDITTIKLSDDLEKTFTIIHGTMGKGKTTLLDAIYWCLYGKHRSSSNSETDENIINNNILDKLNVNDENDTSIQIGLYENDELIYTIKRIITFKKVSESDKLSNNPIINGRISSGITIDESISLQYKSEQTENEEWESENRPEQVKNIIEVLFPQSLSSYFLFDAELLNDFFNDNDQEHVKNGIEKISGIPIIQKASKHLDKVYEDIISSVKNVNTEQLKNNLHNLGNTKDNQEQIIKTESENVKKIDSYITHIDTYLRNHNEQHIKDQTNRRDRLVEDINNAKSDRYDHQKKFGDWLLNINTKIRLVNSMKTCIERCNEWEREGKIPIAVSSFAIKNILSKDETVCICGTPLTKGSKERLHLERLQEKNLLDSPITQGITIGRGNWEDMVEHVDTTLVSKDLKEFRAKRAEFNKTIYESDIELKELNRDLERSSLKDVLEKSQQLRELKSKRDEYQQNKNRAEVELGLANEGYILAKQQLDNMMAKDKKHESQKNQTKLAETLEKIFDDCEEQLIEEFRTRVSEKTTAYFLKLSKKPDDYSKIKIDSEYKTILYSNDEKIKNPSAGEKCCLALSHIAAIRDIAGKNYFMMIDSPLHNISQEERVNIAKNLPKFLPTTQITLLVQDQEYTGTAKEEITGESIPSVRDTLMNSNCVWKEYILKFHKYENDKSHSTILDVVGDES